MLGLYSILKHNNPRKDKILFGLPTPISSSIFHLSGIFSQGCELLNKDLYPNNP